MRRRTSQKPAAEIVLGSLLGIALIHYTVFFILQSIRVKKNA